MTVWGAERLAGCVCLCECGVRPGAVAADFFSPRHGIARRAEIGGVAAFLLCAAECGSETERRHRAEGKVRGVTACGPPEG